MGDDMVVVFSFDAFTRTELLAGRLVSFGGALTTRSLFSKEESLASLIGRILYRLFNSNTGGGRVEVVKARPETWGGGIFDCTIDKVSECDIKVSDQPTEEESSPVCKSLVVAVESGVRRPNLLPPRPSYFQQEVPWVPSRQRIPLPSWWGNLCLDAPVHCT